MKKYIISKEEYEEIKKAEKKNREKKTYKRLQILILRYEGKKDQEIAERLGYNRKYISQCCAEFKRVGLEEYIRQKCGGNHRNMSYETEAEVLESLKEKAEKGQLITTYEIKAALEEKLGKQSHTGYVYDVLKRHGWSRKMPRSRHPKKASDEDIESSKKLTQK